MKKLDFEVKEKMVALSGACFWFWNSYYSFLESCGVPRRLIQKFPKDAYNKYDLMRNVLSALEDSKDWETINAIISNFYKMRGPLDRDQLDGRKAKILLNEFRELIGNDPIEEEIRRQAQAKARKRYEQSIGQYKSKSEQLNALNVRFVELASGGVISPQARGFALEDLFFDVLAHSEFEFTPPYRTTQGEQIDGHFRYEKFDYLVEAKWTDGITKQPELSVFDGKIRGKAQSTRGFFISANGFDENAIRKFSGDAPRIILMTGEDIALVLNGQIDFSDATKAKVDAIVRKGRIYLPLREVT